MEIPQSLLDYLAKMAAQRHKGSQEDFDPMDWSGSNFDDAYAMGVSDGEIETAKMVLQALGLTWEKYT